MEVLAFGSFGFFLLMAAWVVAVFLFLDNECGIGATISTFVFAAVLYLVGGYDIIGFVTRNPKELIAVAIAYFGVGTFWGIIKWWLYVHSKLSIYNESKREWLASRNVRNSTAVPGEHKPEWAKFCERNELNAPSASENKARILRWMCFWWASIIWTLINDFVKGIFRSIYTYMAGTLQRISDRAFSSTDADFEKPKE